MQNTLLDKIQLRCNETGKTVPYEQYEKHMLTFQFCNYCNKKLTTWDEIRRHYYLECPKLKINCDNCEFSFPRKDYGDHTCKAHYLLRTIEAALFMLTLIAIAW